MRMCPVLCLVHARLSTNVTLFLWVVFSCRKLDEVVAEQEEQGSRMEKIQGPQHSLWCTCGPAPLLWGRLPPEYRKSSSCLRALGRVLADVCNIWQGLGKTARPGHLRQEKQSGSPRSRPPGVGAGCLKGLLPRGPLSPSWAAELRH